MQASRQADESNRLWFGVKFIKETKADTGSPLARPLTLLRRCKTDCARFKLDDVLPAVCTWQAALSLGTDNQAFSPEETTPPYATLRR